MNAFGSWLPATVMLIASALAVAWVDLQPLAGGTAVLAIFPPWWSLERSFNQASKAGLPIIGAGPWPASMVLGRSGDAATSRPVVAGSWLVVEFNSPSACLDVR